MHYRDYARHQSRCGRRVLLTPVEALPRDPVIAVSELANMILNRDEVITKG